MLVAAILAGGRSSRFGFGINKCLYPVLGKPMILYIYSKILKTRFFVDTYAIVSMNDAEEVYSLGLNVIIDNYLAGPLPAVYQALNMFSNVFIIACDMPLVDVSSIERMVSMCPRNADACIPKWGSTGYKEPLFAVYRNSLLGLLERCFHREELSITKCLDNSGRLTNILYLDVNKIFMDPYKELFNLNTPKDLKQFYILLGDAHV